MSSTDLTHSPTCCLSTVVGLFSEDVCVPLAMFVSSLGYGSYSRKGNVLWFKFKSCFLENMNSRPLKKIHWLSTETSEFPQSELPRIHGRGRPRVQPGYPHPQEHHSARYWGLKRAQLQGHSASDQRGRDHQHRVVRHRYRGCRLELHGLWRHDTRNDQWERQWAFLGRSV